MEVVFSRCPSESKGGGSYSHKFDCEVEKRCRTEVAQAQPQEHEGGQEGNGMREVWFRRLIYFFVLKQLYGIFVVGQAWSVDKTHEFPVRKLPNLRNQRLIKVNLLLNPCMQLPFFLRHAAKLHQITFFNPSNRSFLTQLKRKFRVILVHELLCDIGTDVVGD